MRIDLKAGAARPWYLRTGLALAKARIGFSPAPVLAMTYRVELLHRALIPYVLRGTSGRGAWDKGHVEMFGAFVSSLNSCHF